MPIKLLTSLLVLLPLILISQVNTKPAPITDTAAFLEELGKKMREAVIEDYKPSKTKVKTQKADYPAPKDITESQVKEMNTAFVNSLSFRPSPFDPNQLMVENDNFFYPESKLVELDLKWLKALDKSNKNLIAKDDKTNEVRKVSMQFSSNQFIKLNSEAGKDIVRIEGEVNIKAPVKFERINLTKDQLLKPLKMDTMQVRLLKMENDLVGIYVSGDYKNIECYPFNADGLQLSVNSFSSMTLGGDPKEIEGLKLPKDLGSGSFIYFKANGEVSQVEVLAVFKYMEQKLKCNHTPALPLESGKIKSDKERYQAFYPTDFSTLNKPDTAVLKAKDRISIIREYNEFDKETKWRLTYQLPLHWIQTAYAVPEFKDLVVTLKNKPVKVSDNQGYYDRESGSLGYIPMNEEYKPVDYDQIKGTVLLKYPATIKTVTIKKGEKKFGVEKIEGNKLTINEDQLGEVKDMINDEILPLRAYGKGAWPLKKDNYTVSESSNNGVLYQYFYFGNIQSVQIDQPGEWIEMSIPFTLKKTVEKTTVKKKGK